MAASIANVYPYGGVRQCLFLAPAVALFVGVAFADLTQRLNVSVRPIATVALLAVIAVCLTERPSGSGHTANNEDPKSVLRTLQTEIGPNDEVWVNHDAAEAMNFICRGATRGLSTGSIEEKGAGQGYVFRLLGSIDSHRKRVWLILPYSTAE